ncbi:MAG: hypothetical protein R3D67_22590, partial [Hyphomicrobiaceae bacterium]
VILPLTLKRGFGVTEVSDGELMAYADGKLDAPGIARVEAALADSAELRERLQRFIDTGKPLADAFRPIFQEPVPKQILEMVRGTSAPSSAKEERLSEPRLHVIAGGSRRGDAPAPVQASRKPSHVHALTRLAASLALVVAGAGAMWLFVGNVHPVSTASLPGSGADGGLVSVGRLLQTALETKPSRAVTTAPIGNKAKAALRVTSTFASRDQRFCRDYVLSLGEADEFMGVACRNASEGGWVIEHQARIDHRPPARVNTGVAGESAKSAVDATIDRLIDGGPLDPGEEERQLQSGWTARVSPR